MANGWHVEGRLIKQWDEEPDVKCPDCGWEGTADHTDITYGYVGGMRAETKVVEKSACPLCDADTVWAEPHETMEDLRDKIGIGDIPDIDVECKKCDWSGKLEETNHPTLMPNCPECATDVVKQ